MTHYLVKCDIEIAYRLLIFQTGVMDSDDVVVDGIDLMEAMEEDIDVDEEASAAHSPDPMAGIGYWESPGNSPKPARKCVAAEGDNNDFVAGPRPNPSNIPVQEIYL